VLPVHGKAEGPGPAAGGRTEGAGLRGRGHGRVGLRDRHRAFEPAPRGPGADRGVPGPPGHLRGHPRRRRSAAGDRGLRRRRHPPAGHPGPGHPGGHQPQPVPLPGPHPGAYRRHHPPGRGRQGRHRRDHDHGRLAQGPPGLPPRRAADRIHARRGGGAGHRAFRRGGVRGPLRLHPGRLRPGRDRGRDRRRSAGAHAPVSPVARAATIATPSRTSPSASRSRTRSTTSTRCRPRSSSASRPSGTTRRSRRSCGSRCCTSTATTSARTGRSRTRPRTRARSCTSIRASGRSTASSARS